MTLVTPNCYVAKIDIKDAYYSVPILPEHQKYLKFYFRGKLYQFKCLPNGLCSGPRKFTKLLKPPLSYLRLQQVTVAGFIGDLITMGRCFVECERNIKLIVTLLHSLGILVHSDKPIFVPARSIEYLGFINDSKSTAISLTQKEKASIKQLCQEVLQEEFLIINKIARLLDKFMRSFSAVRFGPLHYRSLERDKILVLKFAKGKFDKKMKVSKAGKMDILWWINNIEYFLLIGQT